MRRLGVVAAVVLSLMLPAQARASDHHSEESGCTKSATIGLSWTSVWSWCPFNPHRIVVKLFRRSDGERVIRRGPWANPGSKSVTGFNNDRFIWVDWWIKTA